MPCSQVSNRLFHVFCPPFCPKFKLPIHDALPQFLPLSRSELTNHPSSRQPSTSQAVSSLNPHTSSNMCEGKFYSFACGHCQEEWKYCHNAKELNQNGIVVRTNSVSTQTPTHRDSSSDSSSSMTDTVPVDPALTAASSESRGSSLYIGESTDTFFEQGSPKLPCVNATVDLIENDEEIKCENLECRIQTYRERWTCCACGHQMNSEEACAGRIPRRCRHHVCENCHFAREYRLSPFRR